MTLRPTNRVSSKEASSQRRLPLSLPCAEASFDETQRRLEGFAKRPPCEEACFDEPPDPINHVCSLTGK